MGFGIYFNANEIARVVDSVEMKKGCSPKTGQYFATAWTVRRDSDGTTLTSKIVRTNQAWYEHRYMSADKSESHEIVQSETHKDVDWVQG